MAEATEKPQAPRQRDALVREFERILDAEAAAERLRLGEVLVGEGLVTPQQVVETLMEQRRKRDVPLGTLLVEKGLVTRDQIQRSLARKAGIALVDPARFEVDPEVLLLFNEELVRKHTVLPVYRKGNRLLVVMEDPLASATLDELCFTSGLQITAAMAPRAAILDAIDRAYHGNEFDDSELQELIHVEGQREEEEDALLDEGAVADNVLVRLVNKIIMDAYHRRASDIHIEPHSGRVPTAVRFRRDGSLLHYCDISPVMRRAVVARIKIMAGLDISERRRPQDGKIDFGQYSRVRLELRVATIPTVGGEEDVIIRLLGAGELIPVDELGLTRANHKRLMQVISHPYGLFLVCGPTGSGKTTTLHSAMRYLNTEDRKIWTVEDPVEITQRGLRQVQVNRKIGVTFASSMRAFLRADPDIIMVGELRDSETTAIGIEASLTGHLVLATLHTNSAPESLLRLLDLGMDPFNFADALLGVLAQRLAKRLCTHCRVAYRPDEDELQQLVEEYSVELIPDPSDQAYSAAVHREVRAAWDREYAESGGYTLHRPTGCDHCDGTGYSGRMGVHELMVATPKIRQLILRRATTPELMQAGISEGMRTLKQDGISKVLQGLTDIHQVRKVCSR